MDSSDEEMKTDKNICSDKPKLIEDEMGREMYEKDINELESLQYPSISETSPKEYVNQMINHVTDLFNRERGKDETKKANLGDIKSS